MADERELRARIADLEARVAALELQSRIGSVQPSPIPPAKTDAESGFGLKIVNRVGAVTLAVGIIFFFKYAAENQWIGPATRVLLGFLISAVLLASSEYFVRRGQPVFSQGLAGCGVATLYISLYAAFGFYKLIGASFAFLLLLLLSVGVIALSVQRRNAVVAILGLLGALLTPQLIELTRPATWVSVQGVYLLLLQLTALAVAVRLQSRLLVPIAAGMVAFTASLRIYPFAAGTFGWLMLALAVAHFASWARSRTAEERDGLASILICAHCFLALAGLRAIHSWTGQQARSAAGSIFLAIYGLVLLAMGLSNGSNVNRGLGLSFLGFVVLKLYLVDVWTLNLGTRITAFVALGVIMLLASFLYGRVRSKA